MASDVPGEPTRPFLETAEHGYHFDHQIAIGAAGPASAGPRVSEPMLLLGRDKECAALDRLRADVVGSASRVLVLRGAPGAGKSALLRYFLSQISGFTVLTAVGVESEWELAYSGLHQLFAPLLPDRLGRLLPPQRAALSTALGLAAGPPPDRFLVGLAALSLVADAAEQRPVACIVDDGQWLDHASALVLSFVARRLLAEPVAVVCAARTGSGDDGLAQLPELQLNGLGASEARTLLLRSVHGPVDPAVVEQVVTESGGNPLALLELPRTWRVTDLAGGFGLPDVGRTTQRIEQSYIRRLGMLPPETQLVALAAAAEPLGDPVLLSRAAELLGTSLAAAAPAVDVGLLTLDGRVRFVHPLARAAAYRFTSADQRHLVHRALADVTDAEADPDRRAWHLSRATVAPNEDVAAELEISAGRARARGGQSAAAAFLTRAADLTPDPKNRTRRALDATVANVQAGAFDTARRLLAEVSRRPVQPNQRAMCELLGAQLTLAATRGRDAAGPLLAAAQELVSLDLKLARETYLDAFSAALFGARLNHGVDVPDVATATRAVPRPADSEARAVDLLLDAFTALTTGYEDAVPVCRDALRKLGDDRTSPDAELRWFWHGTVLALELWDDRAAYLMSQHHTEVARSTGALSQLALALSSHTTVLVFRGDISAATSAVWESESLTNATGIASAPYAALHVTAWCGQERQTKELVDATVREASQRGEGIGVAFAEFSHALLCNALGQYDEAFIAASRATQDHRELVAHNFGLNELVEAAERVGRHDVAVDAQRRLAWKARASGTDWALGVEARTRAQVSDGAVADDLYRRAIAHLGKTDVQSELARAHLLYGEWLRRANRRRDARRELAEAQEAFTALGGAAFAERASRELLATGANPHRNEVSAALDLTPQELHVASLARNGLSNSEIGAQLFLSARTVEWHLSKVFNKLGITSRRQLRVAIDMRGRAAPPAPDGSTGGPRSSLASATRH